MTVEICVKKLGTFIPLRDSTIAEAREVFEAIMGMTPEEFDKLMAEQAKKIVP